MVWGFFWHADVMLKSALLLAFDQKSGSQIFVQEKNNPIDLQTLLLIKKSFNDLNIFTTKAQLTVLTMNGLMHMFKSLSLMKTF